MGVFEIKLLYQVTNNTKTKFNTVIETGTCLGYSTERFCYYFNNVHTIDIQESLYLKAKEKFSTNPKVHCYLGDSPAVIRDLATTITDPVLFFLDAHWSGDNSVNWEASNWKGYYSDLRNYNTNIGRIETGCRGKDKSSENQNPICEELQIIMDNYKQEVIIYIDDMDKFDNSGNGTKDQGFAGEDWSHLTVSKLTSIVQPRCINMIHVDNQMLIYLSAV